MKLTAIPTKQASAISAYALGAVQPLEVDEWSVLNLSLPQVKKVAKSLIHKLYGAGPEEEDEVSRGLKLVEAEAGEFGFVKLARDSVAGTPVRWRITCVECGEVEEHAWNARTPPDIMVRNLRNRHWEVDHKRDPKCPKCANGRETAMTKTVSSVGPDPKIARKIYAALEDHFLEAAKRYEPGWDDNKVAKSLDVSAELVIKLRREAFGELAEDPAVSVLRDDVELLKMELAEQTERISKEFYAKVDELRAKAEKGLASLEGRFGALLNKSKVA